jgi:hypothetical protein
MIFFGLQLNLISHLEQKLQPNSLWPLFAAIYHLSSLGILWVLKLCLTSRVLGLPVLKIPRPLYALLLLSW